MDCGCWDRLGFIQLANGLRHDCCHQIWPQIYLLFFKPSRLPIQTHASARTPCGLEACCELSLELWICSNFFSTIITPTNDQTVNGYKSTYLALLD
jgi:hypothetical protein